MKKTSILFMAATLVGLVACNKETAIDETLKQQEEGIKTEIVGANTEENGTKATVADETGNFVWTDSDFVAFYVSDGGVNSYVKSASAFSIVGGAADFTVSYAAGGHRSNYAFYPYYLVMDKNSTEGNTTGTGVTTKVILPSEYTLSEVTGTTTPCPMVAQNTGNSWEFKQLCGLLRLTINGIPEGTTRKLTVKFNGNNVSGLFDVTGLGTDSPSISSIPFYSSERATADDIITITSESAIANGTVINIPLPAGTYSDISVMAYDAAGDGTIAFVGNLRDGKTTQAIVRKKAGARTITLNNDKFFSVADKKYALFASGNLQAVFTLAGSSCSWKFADTQYSIVGTNTANTAVGSGEVTNAGTVDLFGWVGKNSVMTTGWAPYGITSNTNSAQYGNTANETLMHDWGELEIGTHVAGTYHTPTGGSSGEWYYLLTSRSGAESKYGFATVCTVTGVILLPDSFIDPKKNQGEKNFVPTVTDKFTDNVYTEGDEWNSMQSAGAIFLPFAGFRRPNNHTVDGVGTRGYYWSSTGADTETAYSAYFWNVPANNGINVSGSDNRRFGRAVRLIRDLN